MSINFFKLIFWAAVVATTASACKKIPASELNYDFFEAKGKLRYQEEGEDRRVNLNVRMQRDSVIWISLRGGPGIEGARLLIGTDSLLMLNRLNKEYYAYSYPDLSEAINFDVNVDIFQSIMVGNPIVLSDTADIITTREGSFRIATQFYQNLQIQSKILRENRKVKEMLITDLGNNNRLVIKYNEFKPFNNKYIPYKVEIALDYADESKTDTQFELNYNRIDIPSEPLSFPFGIPSRFRKSYIQFQKM